MLRAATPLSPVPACNSHYNPGLALLSSEPMFELLLTISLFLLRYARPPDIDHRIHLGRRESARITLSSRHLWGDIPGHSSPRAANRDPQLARSSAPSPTSVVETEAGPA